MTRYTILVVFLWKLMVKRLLLLGLLHWELWANII
nr:MAG TPA: hypothetical protein [Caudoviricetes sp.]